MLVGTVSVSDSEELSRLFTQRGIRHHVLNAKYHDREAAIVAEAGQRGAVTIATNMAGRGTDIKLDAAARKAGGLLVIGTERYDSRRVDDQLRGRSGRQGDPGESRFYLSLEDSLLRLYGGRKLAGLFEAQNVPEGEGLTHSTLTRAVDQAQKRIVSDRFAQRQKMVGYDRVLNEQREAVYAQRLRVLQTGDVHGMIVSMLRLTAQDAVAAASGGKTPEARKHLAAALFSQMLTPGVLSDCEACPEEALPDRLAEALIHRCDSIEASFGDSALLRERERELLLKTVDRHWMEQMDDLEHLRQGIGLVTYAQRDPLEEYQIKAFRLFDEMNRNIRYDTALAMLSIGQLKVRS